MSATEEPVQKNEAPLIFVVGARGVPDVEGGAEKNAEMLFPLVVASGYRVTLVGLADNRGGGGQVQDVPGRDTALIGVMERPGPLPALGLDLSEAYIRHARRHLKRWSRLNLIVANAESIPAPDNSCDAVTSIFMVHELPPAVRRTLIGEAARVLKPGGRLVLIDSLQRGD